MPVIPSTITWSPVRIRDVASGTPTTAGVASERARIAACENFPPRSVTKARTRCISRPAVVEASSSSVTTMASSGTSGSSARHSVTSADSTRRPMSRMSAARSRR